ncbi:hypothetical protein Tco_1396511, partial [Tanacetum coccineum]
MGLGRMVRGGPNLVCENCGFSGHTIDRCFKIIGYLVNFRKKKVGPNFKGNNVSNNNFVGTSSSSAFSEEQMATLISFIKDNSINGRGVHANMAGLITDLGANQHMTYTDKFLVNVIDVTHLKIKISHPNGTEAFITKNRNMPLTQYLTLYDVLVVPKYCVSLMVMHKFDRDSKLIVAFDEMNCYVSNQDLRAGIILGTGKQISGLHYFDGNQESEQFCNVCQRAKQTRGPFPLSDHVSTELVGYEQVVMNLVSQLESGWSNLRICEDRPVIRFIKLSMFSLSERLKADITIRVN